MCSLSPYEGIDWKQDYSLCGLIVHLLKSNDFVCVSVSMLGCITNSPVLSVAVNSEPSPNITLLRHKRQGLNNPVAVLKYFRGNWRKFVLRLLFCSSLSSYLILNESQEDTIQSNSSM